MTFFVLGILGAPLVEPSLEGTLDSLGRDRHRRPIRSTSAAFIGYFALGYLLYASILVGIGSVCNTLKEAQNLMQPVMIVLMLPLLAMIPIANDPNGLLARVLSFVPPLTPFTMMNRVGGRPELWEYAVTSVLLLVTIVIAFRGAAKVFRIGILMTASARRYRRSSAGCGRPSGWFRIAGNRGGSLGLGAGGLWAPSLGSERANGGPRAGPLRRPSPSLGRPARCARQGGRPSEGDGRRKGRARAGAGYRGALSGAGGCERMLSIAILNRGMLPLSIR